MQMVPSVKERDAKGLTFSCRAGPLEGLVDADYLPNYGTEFENLKSTTGYGFTLSNSCICHKSKKQSTQATSSCHAECMAAYGAAREAYTFKDCLSLWI